MAAGDASRDRRPATWLRGPFGRFASRHRPHATPGPFRERYRSAWTTQLGHRSPTGAERNEPALWSTLVVNRRFKTWPGSFCLVELGGLEPPAPCLQSDVYVRPRGADLADQLSASSREIPLLTPANGTLMARPAGAGRCLAPDGAGGPIIVPCRPTPPAAQSWSDSVPASMASSAAAGRLKSPIGSRNRPGSACPSSRGWTTTTRSSSPATAPDSAWPYCSATRASPACGSVTDSHLVISTQQSGSRRKSKQGRCTG